ncbi:MAG: FAD-binding oxidoreductase [Alphaproteobacteria bacterium]|nr:FAD-binding oxidoreductase [Alphaproteobacteria bacterium]
MTDIVAKLKSIVGEAYCLSGADERQKYDRDVTGEYQSTSIAVVRPASTAEVSEILRLASETKTPVVPLSGNTGLAGGGFGGDGQSIILSLDRMNTILEINPKSRIARVEAGVILGHLHEAVDAHDLVFPLLFGARGSCMIGGNLSTNAGGSNVVRYGNTRALCLGLEVVTADGEIINLMSELHKDNTGYDLKDLFIGAEGTLGVITAAVLKLFPKPKAYASAMVSVPDLDGALALLHRIQAASGGGVEAFEYMPENYFRHLKMIDPDAPMPFPKPAKIGIFIEVAAVADKDAVPKGDGSIPVQNVLMATLAGLMDSGAVLDATIAQNEAQRAEMWRQREIAFEVANHLGVPITTDVSVPLDKVGEFLNRANVRLADIAPDAELIEIAHLGDGNLHYSMWVDPENRKPASKEMQTAIYTMVEDVVEELGGSFSAEHGIGISKRGSMARRKDKGALSVMRAIKNALDPDNIMNPGKVLP